MIPRGPLVLFAVLLLACGGKVDGGDTGDAGTHGSSSGSDSGSGSADAVSTVDSPFVNPTPESGPTPVVCTQQGGGGSGGQGSCEVSGTETCSDGSSYTVDCSCPGGTCSCSESSPTSGSSGGGIPFTGCPACPADLTPLFALCGFPQ